jgi:hypothetical protein
MRVATAVIVAAAGMQSAYLSSEALGVTADAPLIPWHGRNPGHPPDQTLRHGAGGR